jgi:hypothetical protein
MRGGIYYITTIVAVVVCILMLIPNVFIASSLENYFSSNFGSLEGLIFLFSPPTGWLVFFGSCLLLAKTGVVRTLGIVCVYLGAGVSIFAFLAPVL